MKPQTRRILDLLRSRGSLTQREAIELAGCYRLAARIGEIRSELGDDLIRSDTEHHEGGTHARYCWTPPRDPQLSLEVA